ncbi:MAG: efflux RND transporter permease subunit [Kordiimonadaceae bacterium]|nr:efflux RND transporter permease subunit [Kordiimonadaceae bacterium]MBO6568592.1 efflux RND transporter permease subunit [Kordiimonadaceae bacterium]MBO6965432.1 efflux RND transporter permease subunit [Kordiimonadaceae bacterium]
MTDTAAGAGSIPEENTGGLTAFAMNNSVTVVVIVILLALTGISSYFSLPKQQDPGFIIRNAVVTTVFPGANPGRVEELVTDPIEEALQEIPELDYTESKSRNGVSIITVTFQEKYKNMRPLFDQVRRKVDDLVDEGGLPSGAFEPMVNDEYGDVFGILFSLTGDGFTPYELKEIAEDIRNDLLDLDNIAKVDIHGVQDEVIYVEYSAARLQELGLTPSQLQSALSSANILQSGGDLKVGQERILLEPTGNYTALEDLGRTVIRLPSGGVVYLEDIAEIERTYVDPRESMTRYNGGDNLVLAISLKEGGDILALDKELKASVPVIEAKHPYGIELTRVFSQPTLVEDSVNSFMSNLVQAVAIVAMVMFAFLGFRTGVIVSALIPTTIVVTFVCMSVFDITVNQISLAALIIALGLLVDNAIVMAEAIMIRRENGEDKFTAAIMAGREMSIPLLISSLTTCSAFLAIFLAESATGEYTADIFKVVSIALISSWLMAMTFIPILTTVIMKVNQKPAGETTSPYKGAMYRLYRLILFPSLRLKLAPLVIAVALFFVAMSALQLVPQVFIPERRDPIINAKFEMPRGTDIAVTEAILHDIEAYLLDRYGVTGQNEDAEGITDILGFIGVGTPRYVLAINPDQEDTHRGAMIILTTSEPIIAGIIKDVEDYAGVNYPDLVVKMRKMENGKPIDYPVEVRVSGDNIDTLYAITAPLKEKLLSMQGVRDVNDDWGQRRKKIIIDVDQDRARRAGVTNSDVATSLSTGLSGLQLTEFRDGNDVIPVELRSISADRENLSRLDGLTVYAQGNDASVPLSQVADVSLAWDNAIIMRRDRTRTLTVRTQHYPGVTATEVLDQLLPFLDGQTRSWPAGYTYELGGEFETSGDAGASVAEKLPISGMLIFLLLVAQFNSTRKTIIILMTIPLGLIGVTFGLIVADSIFGFMTILGVISLAGIIINNAIVLIDRINIERDENGRSAADAVIEACQQRLRPIMLTTCTTVGGMLPLWISRDPMFETMAVAIIFGLLFATLLTLVIVPVLYSIFFGVKYDRASLVRAG